MTGVLREGENGPKQCSPGLAAPALTKHQKAKERRAKSYLLKISSGEGADGVRGERSAGSWQ